MMPIKPAEQILFDRVKVTWVEPEVQRRVQQGLVTQPMILTHCLILCKKGKTDKVLLNQEVWGDVVQLQAIFVNAVTPEEPVMHSNITGITKIILSDKWRGYSFIFFILGKDGRYYLISKSMAVIVGNREFEMLYDLMRTEGIEASQPEHEVQVYFDFVQNMYNASSTPALKRRAVKDLAEARLSYLRRQLTQSVKRHLRLPIVFIHPENEFMPLLLEVRATYIDGYFFSCIASAATTADRICNALTQRYGLSRKDQRWYLEQTFGQKFDKLVSNKIITKQQKTTLVKMNDIRNRHIHPRKTISELSMKRDAFVMTKLLHEFMNETYGVQKDHTFHEGRLVPRRLI
ncbi:MAG TPA: hypothetical protein VN937_27700 [Blastocatellia bacterium]|nr:hypothetical protein [Blastocatellia bacterium]